MATQEKEGGQGDIAELEDTSQEFETLRAIAIVQGCLGRKGFH